MVDVESKRASLIHENCQKNQDEKEEEGHLPDKFGFIRVTVLLLGLTTLLTGTFLTSAYDYWMYKFRDPAMGPIYNAANKTVLQTNFQSGMMLAMGIPSMVGLAFGVTLAQKFKSRLKIYICYGIVIFVYLLTTIFVEIDTDNWQLEFFVITFVLLGIKSLIFTTLLTTVIVVIPKLPPIYLKWFMYGQGASGIFSVISQILCLAVTDNSQTTGLIYFISGTLIFVVTLVMYYFTQYSPIFKRYANDNTEVTVMVFPKWIEIKRAFFVIWPVLLIQALVILSQSTTSFANLIVSENYGDHTDWTQKYFVPVVSIFYGDVVGLIGRVLARPNVTKKTAKWHILICVARVIIFTPLFMFCNMKTNNRKMETLFTHDWEYIVILGAFVLTQGYFNTCSVISIRNFVKEGEKVDIYYLLLTVILTVSGFLFSPITILLVNSL